MTLNLIQLQDKRRLGIATLGGVASSIPGYAAFRDFIEGWYLSYFTPDAARSLPLAGPQRRRLNSHGDNLGNVVQYMEREHPATAFERHLGQDSRPEFRALTSIDTQQSPDGRLLLSFNGPGF